MNFKVRKLSFHKKGMWEIKISLSSSHVGIGLKFICKNTGLLRAWLYYMCGAFNKQLYNEFSSRRVRLIALFILLFQKFYFISYNLFAKAVVMMSAGLGCEPYTLSRRVG